MSKDIWSAVGLIGDDLVSAADEHHVKVCFKQKKKRVFVICAGAAACFALVLSVAVAVPAITKNAKLTADDGGNVGCTEDEGRTVAPSGDVNGSPDTPKGEAGDHESPTETQGEYPIIEIHSSGDWPWYSTVGEIVDASTEIFSGKVTGISFEIVDLVTGKADRSPDSESTNRMLYTLFHIEVSERYKGEAVSEKVIGFAGGQAGYNEAEQYALMESSGLLGEYPGIPVTVGYPSFRMIGSEFLFCTVRTSGDYDYAVNPDQFALRLDSESAKRIIHFVK